MLLRDDRSCQAYCLDGGRSVSVVGSARGGNPALRRTAPKRQTFSAIDRSAGGGKEPSFKSMWEVVKEGRLGNLETPPSVRKACSAFTQVTARTLAESLNDPFHLLGKGAISAQQLHRGSGDGTYTTRTGATRETPSRGLERETNRRPVKARPGAAEASDRSSPSRLLRLLPAGAILAGRDLHPLKNRAFPRHTTSSSLRPGLGFRYTQGSSELSAPSR
ncbi:hypothetical protein SAMN05443247_09404 [Bradyrhizobium erythrophlei]|jgi:hypothetical protein|nr:hypothetical protein SAMN05443247_09404 [Bradyrhizobium erythrophlei]